MNIPLIRAYHRPSNSFITDGFLTLDNKFLIVRPNELPVPLADITIDFFTGRFAESGQPVYQNDIVEIATLNEFGSAFIDQGIVRYEVKNMCYAIVSKNVADQPLPTKITRVIGHDHI